MKLHERTLHVQGATAAIGLALLRWDVQEDWDLNDRILALTQHQLGIARRMAGLPPRFPTDYPGLHDFLDNAQRAHELTDVEMLRVVVGEVYALSKYALRQERHPDDPDARADEAPD
jgi:hypothetical protein